MKMFRNLALALISVSMIHQNAECHEPVKYARTLVDTQDYAWPVPFPEDPFHAKMLATGLYTAADAIAMDNAAAAEFLRLYGIDFNPTTNLSVVVNPINGRRTIPGFPATWFSYFSENDAFVVYDSKNPLRGKVFPWVNNKYGIQILFGSTIAPIDIASGVNQGGVFQASSLFSFGDFNYIRVGSNPHYPINREVIKYQTSNLSYSHLNQYLQGQFTVTLQVTDEDGNVGKYIGTTEIYKDPLGISGQNFLRENPVSTWRVLN